MASFSSSHPSSVSGSYTTTITGNSTDGSVSSNTFKGVIKAIFLAEFHNIVGPKIVFQIPDGYLESEEFDIVSDYIIPKPTLAGRFTCVRTKYKDTNRPADWIVGTPVCMSHCKYKRNALIFNVCFILDGSINTKYFTPYENLIRKIAKYVATLEAESEFLFNESKKQALLPILQQVFVELNENASCEIIVDDANKWYLRIDPVWNYSVPPDTPDHQVPVPIVDLLSVMKGNFLSNDSSSSSSSSISLNTSHLQTEELSNCDWDPFFLRIVKHINGTNYVKKIQILAEVDPGTLKDALRHLIYYKAIVMADIFQYSNMYRVTDAIHKLITDKDMQEKCITAVTLYPRKTHSPPAIQLVMDYYARLIPGETLQKFCQLNHPDQFNIDVHKFILFGVLNGILKRVHKYPLAICNHIPPDIPRSFLEKMIDGKHTYDEISVKLPHYRVEDLFSRSIFK